MDPQDVMIWSMARCHDPARPATWPPLKRVVCDPPPGVNRSTIWTCRRTDCSFLEDVAPHPSTWVASRSEAVPTQDPVRPTHCSLAESYENANMPASEPILEVTECGIRRWTPGFQLTLHGQAPFRLAGNELTECTHISTCGSVHTYSASTATTPISRH